MRTLAAIMRQADAPPSARIQAIAVLLDRGWGRPIQPRTDEDGGSIRIIIRRFTDAASEAEPVLIEHEALKK